VGHCTELYLDLPAVWQDHVPVGSTITSVFPSFSN
jgi:hypothetical protein